MPLKKSGPELDIDTDTGSGPEWNARWIEITSQPF
jgi:hypothetical protein